MFRKHKQLFKHLDEYFAMAEECLRKFHDAVEYTVEKGVDQHLEVLVAEISEKEQNCDDLRRSIEHEMFSKSLLPETREDLLEIIEKLDQIPNHCQDVSCMIFDQNTEIIPSIHKDVIELIQICSKTFKLVVKATKDCFGSMEHTLFLLREIDDLENMAKGVQRKMIRSIFKIKDLRTHPGGQLVQKEMVVQIGEICALSKHIAEKITITAIKRRV